MARPICSVIISARNEAARLEACFHSLSQQRTNIPFEVILVDSGSTDDTFQRASRLAKQLKGFRVFRESQPGASAARNFAAHKARGQILIFTDADCRLSRTWLQEIAKPLLKPAQYPLAAVGGRTLSDFSQTEKPNLVERYLDQLFLYWERDRLSAFPHFLPWASAGNLAVKRQVFLQLGGFDTQWKNAAYDVDFCWRLALCGFVLGYAPKAEAYHLRSSNLYGLMRQAGNYAFCNRSLLDTYESLLKIPRITLPHQRLLARSRRTLKLLQTMRSLRQVSFRGLDLLSLLSEFTGELQSQVARVRPNEQLNQSRRGHTPPRLEKLLPAGYSFLHKEGWCYWKHSSAVNEEGDLILFRPQRHERFRLNSSAWKIWEVKAERGQSEDAAQALGQKRDNPEVLRNIDELTLDLRTRRLLP